MKKVAFFLEGIDQNVIPFTLDEPDDVFLKDSLEACIQAKAKKHKLKIQHVEPLSQTDNSYRVYFTKKEGSIFSRKNRTYIYYVKVL